MVQNPFFSSSSKKAKLIFNLGQAEETFTQLKKKHFLFPQKDFSFILLFIIIKLRQISKQTFSLIGKKQTFSYLENVRIFLFCLCMAKATC